MGVARQQRVDADPTHVGRRDRDEDDETTAQATATALSHAIIDRETRRDAPDAEEATTAAPPTASATTSAPAPTSGGLTVKLGGGVHIVGPGDTLWGLAEVNYGRGAYWTRIKAANSGKVRGESTIRDGTVLAIPEIEVATLDAMKRFEDQPEQLRNLVVLMSDQDYEGFLASLSTDEKERNARLLQLAEINRATGMTIEELAVEQRHFLKEKADARGESISGTVTAIVENQGFGGSSASAWTGLDAAVKRDWYRRFEAVVASIKASAPADILEIIETAESKAGGFAWAPAENERLEAFAYTNGDWKIYCGTLFVGAAETDPASVYANIAHELGGHNYYGDNEFGFDIAYESMTASERNAAERGGNSIYSAYGYMESEIFANLYEYPYDSPSNATIHPFDTDRDGRRVTNGPGDVVTQLRLIKRSFAPVVASGVIAGLARRVEMDPRIVPEAKERFLKSVENVFGYRP